MIILRNFRLVALVCTIMAHDTVKGIDVLGFNVGFNGQDGSRYNFATLQNFGQGHSVEAGLTICLRFSMHLLFRQWFLSVEEGYNVLSLTMYSAKSQQGFLFLDGAAYMFIFNKELYPATWYHFCASVDVRQKSIDFVLDGTLLHDDLKELKYLDLHEKTFGVGKTLTLGHTSDYGFPLDFTQHYMHGYLTDLNIWSEPLPLKELVQFTSVCNESVGSSSATVFDWQNDFGDLIIGSYIQKTNEKLGKICSPQLGEYISLFPYPMENKDASWVCLYFGSNFYTPRNQSDFESLIGSFDAAIFGQACNQNLWMPIDQMRLSDGNLSWVDRATLAYPEYLPWEKGQPNGRQKQKCVVARSTSMKYLDDNCDEKYCSVCKIQDKEVFHLRGLPPELNMDSSYYMKKEFYNGKHVFQGFMKNRMQWNSTLEQWTIVDTNNNKILAMSEATIPIGLNQWKVIDKSGPATKQSLIALKYTRCHNDSFTCGTGFCMPQVKRCNGIYDCWDRIDEDQCDILSIDEGSYQKRMAPATDDHPSTPIVVDVAILSIYEIDEVMLHYMSRIKLDLMWYDHRIKLNNLKEEEYKNLLSKREQDKLWLPILRFTTSAKVKFTDKDNSVDIMALKLGTFRSNTRHEVAENFVFEGSGNPLKMTKFYDQQYYCNFQLQYYPFDTQKCQIGFIVPHSLKNKIMLQRGNLTMTTKYMDNIRYSWVIATVNGSSSNHGEETIALEITIRRVFFFHLATTFGPTACLTIISELILILDEDHFDTIIMIALTTMLVMYTLYQSVSASLPQTSYLKLIDLWLVFGLLIPFVVFVASVMLRLLNKPNIIDNDPRLTVKSMSKVKDELEEEIRCKNKKQRCRRAVQIVIPGCTITFMVMYSVFAMVLYNEFY